MPKSTDQYPNDDTRMECAIDSMWRCKKQEPRYKTALIILARFFIDGAKDSCPEGETRTRGEIIEDAINYQIELDYDEDLSAMITWLVKNGKESYGNDAGTSGPTVAEYGDQIPAEPESGEAGVHDLPSQEQ